MIEPSNPHRKAAMSNDRALEIGLWRNGKPVAVTAIYSVLVYRDASWVQRLVSIHPGEEVTVHGRWGNEISPGWISGEVMITDAAGAVIGGHRPVLAYLGASDIPVTVAFLSLKEHPLSHIGIWILTIRSADSYQTMLERSKSDQLLEGTQNTGDIAGHG